MENQQNFIEKRILIIGLKFHEINLYSNKSLLGIVPCSMFTFHCSLFNVLGQLKNDD